MDVLLEQRAERSLLEGLRVVDLSSNLAARSAARTFAQLGAQVTRAHREPVPGQASATAFVTDGIAVAHGSELNGAIEAAHLVITDNEHPIEHRAAQFCLRVDDFAQDGPYAEWSGSEMIHQALSGLMLLTGDEDKGPLYGVGQRAYFSTGLLAATAALAELVGNVGATHGADRTGWWTAALAHSAGTLIETSVHEAQAAMAQNLSTIYEYNGSSAQRGQYKGLIGTFACRDAYVVVFALRNWRQLCEAFGRPALADDPRFVEPEKRLANWTAAKRELADAASRLNARDIVDAAQRGNAVVEIVAQIDDLWEHEHFGIRGALSKQNGRLNLALPFRIVDERAAPHTTSHQAAYTGAPLSGVRVLDLGVAWAGPMAGRILAGLGADVVRIEGPATLDSWRQGFGSSDLTRYPELIRGDRPWDRNAWFNTQNQGKRGVGLDLRNPDGLEVFRELAAHSDVVIANRPPGQFERLGIGYETLSQLNPRLVVVELPAFGLDGPWAHHVGMGQSMEAATGMPSLIGYGDGFPHVTGMAYLDPAGGFAGALATVAGLVHRARTGRGSHLEVGQAESALHLIGDILYEAARDNPPEAANGNRVEWATPHDAYPCAGDDEWVAIAIADDDEWRRFSAVTGNSELLDDSRFGTVSLRRRNAEQLDRLIAEWTSRLDRHDIGRQLQRLGIRSAPCATAADIAQDPDLWAEGFFTRLHHPDAGDHNYPGIGVHLDGHALRATRAAPRFGQDNDEVLAEFLGSSRADRDRLRSVGALYDDPRSYRPLQREPSGATR